MQVGRNIVKSAYDRKRSVYGVVSLSDDVVQAEGNRSGTRMTAVTAKIMQVGA